LPKHPTTPLASGQIDHDQLAVELVEPDGMPAMVRITWPPQPTVVPTVRFPGLPLPLPACSRPQPPPWPGSKLTGGRDRKLEQLLSAESTPC
jgi:hypothetical protein